MQCAVQVVRVCDRERLLVAEGEVAGRVPREGHGGKHHLAAAVVGRHGGREL